MCGKCGLNNCSCNSGKSCAKLFTGDLTFDGTSFICANGETDQIVTGEDNLNAVLAKMFADICASNNWIARFSHREHKLVKPELDLNGSGDVHWNECTAPVDGKYLIRSVVRYEAVGSGSSTDVNAQFHHTFGALYATKAQVGLSSVTRFRLEYVNPDSVLSIKNTVVVEGYYNMTEGETVQLTTSGLGFGSVGTITVHTVNTTFQKLD